MIEAIAFGTFWFWVLAVLWAVFVLSSCYQESGFWLTILSLAAVGSLGLAGVDVPSAVASSPLLSLAVAIGYVAVGTGWATFRWWKFAIRYARDMVKNRKYYTSQTNQDGSRKYTDEHILRMTEPASVGSYKEDFYRWITFWPVDALVYAVGEALADLLKAIYDRMSNFWQALSDRAMRHVEDDRE